MKTVIEANFIGPMMLEKTYRLVNLPPHSTILSHQLVIRDGVPLYEITIESPDDEAPPA